MWHRAAALARALGAAAPALWLLAAPAAAAREPCPPLLGSGSYLYGTGPLRRCAPVPELPGKDVFGAAVSLRGLLQAGRRPVLAFWSMRRPAARLQLKAMAAVQSRFADRGVAVVSVNADGEFGQDDQGLREFIAEGERALGFTVNYPVLYDPRNWLTQALSVHSLPTIVTIDAEGRIAGFCQGFEGVPDEDALAAIDGLVRDLLELPAPAAGGR